MLLVVGIVLLGLNLRAAITSLPPVFPELSSSLHLSTASLAVLATVPVLCFAAFSLPAGKLGRRLGEERVLMAAVLLLAGGLVLRGAAPGAMLFPGTVLACGAIALMNVLLPSLVKRRSPQRAGMLIGSYLLMLSAGQVISTAIAVPVFRLAEGGAAGHGSGAGWPVRVTLGLWAFPAALAAVAWLPQLWLRARQVRLASIEMTGADDDITEELPALRDQVEPPPAAGQPNGGAANGKIIIGTVTMGKSAKAGAAKASAKDSSATETSPTNGGTTNGGAAKDGAAKDGAAKDGAARGGVTGGEPREGVFVHRQLLGWQVAAFVGLTAVLFYAPLSWLPTLLQSRGMSPERAGDVLALMNVGNALSALSVPMLAHRARSQRLLVAATAAAVAAGLCGVLFVPIGAAAGPAFLLGLGQGAGLGLGTFFAMARAPDPASAASLSGFAQSVGYLIAAIGPPAVAFLHTISGGWDAPVLALVGFAALQLWSGSLAGRARTLRVLTLPARARRPDLASYGAAEALPVDSLTLS